MKHNMIFGHKSPDTDSVCAAITLSWLKNKQYDVSVPYVLGEINRETQYVLDYFKVDKPSILKDVKLQVKDLEYDKIKPFKPYLPIFYAYYYMNENTLRTLPIVDDNNKLIGIITMKDIAVSMINLDFKILDTSYENIIETLNGRVITRFDDRICGEISVASFNLETLKEAEIVRKNSIVIVGDRYDVIEYAIKQGAKLIIITRDKKLPIELLELAKINKVNILSTPYKTYYTAKNIGLSRYVSDIMIKDNLISFFENDYIEDCREEIENSRHSKFPILSSDNTYLGILSRRHLINPTKKKVILVDHNESGQSVKGLEEAEIIEVVDHHKIGDISTSMPISFRNMPVGSTNTIIYFMYKESTIAIDNKTAGLLISGILSDTLILKSPTTTEFDRNAVYELADILDLDIYKFSMDMFKAGTSLDGKTVEEVFFGDFKVFEIENQKVGISQVFTLNIDDVMNLKEEYISCIDDVTEEKGYFLSVMAVTDIVNSCSYIFYTSEKEKMIKSIFNIENIQQGFYLKDCISRKKQILPILIDGLKNYI